MTGRRPCLATRRPCRFPLPPAIIFWYARHRAVVVVEARPSDFYLTETTIMIFIGILFSIAAIGFLCWLLFTLAVFALPSFAGVTAGIWAYDTGAGWLGAIVVGALAAGLTFGIGQLLLLFVRPLWARIAILLGFVAPAAFAGYHATHGIVKHVMPSEDWQFAFFRRWSHCCGRHRPDAAACNDHTRFDRTGSRAGVNHTTQPRGTAH